MSDRNTPSAPAEPPAAPYGAPAAPTAAAATAPGATPTRQRNALGVIALVAAIVGAVFAAVPGALIVGWILLPIAFVLALVSLFLKGRKGPGIAALTISVVGTIVGVIVFVSSLASAVGSAVEDGAAVDVAAPSAAAEAPAEQSGAEEAPLESAGSRENPAPLGSTVSNDEWEVSVNGVTFGATEAVLAENLLNQEPETGEEYILADVTMTYVGEDEGSPALVQIEYVTPDGVTVGGLESVAVVPDALERLKTLYPGAQIRGNLAFAVPSATAADGTLAVTPGLLGNTVFVAVR